MKWIRYRLQTTEEAEDLVAAELSDLGIRGVEIEDKKPLTEEEKRQMFVDIAPISEADDHIAFLNFYLEPEEESDELLDRIRAALDDLRAFAEIGPCELARSETEDLDWINNWKEHFHQFYVDDILVVPSWESVEEKDADKLILHIDPGTAFGTGMHETTQLCIRALKEHIQGGETLLDIGTGSGILAIAALKLGAKYALGTDLDPCTEPAVADNKEANEIPAQAFELLLGNMITDPEIRKQAGYEAYDIVTANILADVLVPLTPHVVPALKRGGIYITSGILEGYEGKVAKACEDAGLEIVKIAEQGEWRSVIARKSR